MAQIKKETGKWTTTMKRKNTGAWLRDFEGICEAELTLTFIIVMLKSALNVAKLPILMKSQKIWKNYWLVAFDNHWSCGCWLSLCGITKCLNLHQNLRAALCAASDFEPSAMGSSVSKTIREGVYHKHWNLLWAEKEKTITLRKSILQNFSGLPG